MKKRILTGIVIFYALLTVQIQANDDEFPNRELYPEVPYISPEDLYKKKDQSTIVDVRSAYEYDTLRIKGAYNIPLNSSDFVDRIQILRAKSDRPIYFYCNGKTCRKSYKAVRKANKAGIPNTIAYDAGIFDWAKLYPDASELLGKSPIKPGQLLSTEKFKSHLLETADFIDEATKDSIVLDVRDPTQRQGLSIFNGSEIPVPLDNDELKQYVDQAKAQGQTLLIYDAVGKQVRWLQYYLEDHKLQSYYFMKGGAKSFFDDLLSNYQ